MKKVFFFFGMLMSLYVNSQTGYWTDESNYSVDWYESGKNSYTIESEKELAGLAVLVNSGNSFSEKVIYLRNNLDLSAHYWTPIGNLSVNSFSGVFKGNDYVISGINLQIAEGVESIGLFGYINQAVVEGVILESSSVEVKEPIYRTVYGGCLAGCGYDSKIRNCINNSSWTLNNFIAGCFIGGILGEGNYGTEIDYCLNHGNLIIDFPDNDIHKNTVAVGGILGAHGKMISFCQNRGNIEILGDMLNGSAGGIAGKSVEIKNSFNEGNVLLSSNCGSFSGGILGDGDGYAVINCYNVGDITAICCDRRDVYGGLAVSGGIHGHDAWRVENCYNTGKVVATVPKDDHHTKYCGAIIGTLGDYIFDKYRTNYHYEGIGIGEDYYPCTKLTELQMKGEKIVINGEETDLVGLLNGYVSDNPNMEYCFWEYKEGKNNNFPVFSSETPVGVQSTCKENRLKVFVRNGVLYVVSDCNMMLPLYNEIGQLIRFLKIRDADNSYYLPQGAYLFAGKKILL